LTHINLQNYLYDVSTIDHPLTIAALLTI